MSENIEANAAPEQSILKTLHSATILENLETELLQGLARISHRIHLQAGEMVITEGEKSTDLFLIEQGDIEVFRVFDGGSRESRLVTLGPGEPLGEMALLDGQPRSASARAVCESSVLRVRASDLLSLPKGEKLLANLQSALAVAITRRARVSTDKTIAALERELAVGREQNLFGQFFVYVLGVMAIGTLVNNILAKGELDVNVYTQQFAWQYLLVLIIPSALVMLRMKIPLRQMGITTEGLKKSLIEGAVASVILIALAFGAAQILAAFNLVPGKPQPFDPAGALAYFFHSFLQELVARGFMQSSFQRFLNDKTGWRSVFLTGTLFGLFHLHFGFPAVAVTIFSSFIFGALYLRHRNLAGVTLLHFMSGVAAFNSGLL